MIEVKQTIWIEPRPYLMYSAREDKIFLLYYECNSTQPWIEDESGGLKKLNLGEDILMRAYIETGYVVILEHFK